MADLDALFARRTAGIRLGLEIVQRVYDALGRPCAERPAVHVLGTNGKGSVCAMVDHALRRRGHRVGLYTSPHLQRVNERIRIDGAPIDDAALQASLDAVLAREAPDLARPLSFFEVLTLAALHAFEAAGVEVVVAEAGLGGRLDATRLVHARVCAFTSIDLDHQAFLGPDLASIAAEKAAAMRPGTPSISAPQHPEVLAVLGRVAAELGSPLQVVEPLSRPIEGLAGAHQATNAAVALAAARVIDPAVEPSDFDGVRWPGRMQRCSTADGPVIVDVAHNPAGVAALVAALHERRDGGPLAFTFGCAADKDAPTMIETLRATGAPVWLVPLPGERSFSASEHVGPGVEAFAGLDDPELRARWRAHHGAGGTVVLCGSHVLVGAWLANGLVPDPGDPGHPGPRGAG